MVQSTAGQSTNLPYDPEPAPLWLRRGDQLFCGSLLIAAVVLLTVFWVRSTQPGRELIPVEHLPARQFDFQLDINRSNWIEWTLLEGIGEKLARRIVADREARGPFESVQNISRVPGIGPKTLARIRPWLTVGSEPKVDHSPAHPTTPD